MTLGKNIQSARKKSRLTQQELADVLGIHSVALSNIERDVRNPSMKLLRKIAEVLKTDVSTLTKE